MTRINSYTAKQIDWLRERAPGPQSIQDLTDAFNARFDQDRSVVAIRATLKREGIRRGRNRAMPHLRLFSPEQAEFIERAYRTMTVKEIAAAMNTWWDESFTADQVKSHTSRYSVQSGRTGRFEKGCKPANAGTKGVMKPNRTSFKKGRKASEASNYVPIGSLRYTADGYLERKVTDDPDLVPGRRWVPEHRLMWEAEHSPIPEGHAVVFLDGDPCHIELDNLRCVPRGVLAMMNKRGLSRSSGEARKAGILACELEWRAKRRKAA